MTEPMGLYECPECGSGQGRWEHGGTYPDWVCAHCNELMEEIDDWEEWEEEE